MARRIALPELFIGRQQRLFGDSGHDVSLGDPSSSLTRDAAGFNEETRIMLGCARSRRELGLRVSEILIFRLASTKLARRFRAQATTRRRYFFTSNSASITSSLPPPGALPPGGGVSPPPARPTCWAMAWAAVCRLFSACW